MDITLILDQKSKILRIINDTTSYVNENKADHLILLIPIFYANYDMLDCTITLKYVNAENQGDMIHLEFDPEHIYKENYYKTVVLLTNRFTSFVGNLTMWIEILHPEDQLLVKSSTVTVTIHPHIDLNEMITEGQMNFLLDLELRISQLLNTCNTTLSKVTDAENRIMEMAQYCYDTVALMEELKNK